MCSCCFHTGVQCDSYGVRLACSCIQGNLLHASADDDVKVTHISLQLAPNTFRFHACAENLSCAGWLQGALQHTLWRGVRLPASSHLKREE